MFDILGTLVPMLMFFLLLRGILRIILHGGRGGQQEDGGGEYEEDTEAEEYGEQAETQEPPQPTAAKKPDLAAEFERRLKKTSEAAAAAKKAEQLARQSVKPPYAERQRIHREGEQFAHDKGRVYYDPQGDYSYNEELFNAQTAAFRASRAAARQEEAGKPHLKLKHGALVRGFIMSQVLDKPRSLKPYGAEESL